METIDVLKAEAPEALAIVDFYDRALLAVLANPNVVNLGRVNAHRDAAQVARLTTQDRFGVRLILPGDTEDR